MTRPQPRSTLFPYTTLFRSTLAGNASFKAGTCQAITVTSKDPSNNTANVLAATTVGLTDGVASGTFYSDNTRSEEHTSELQSRLHLVCRLLLEKKKKKKKKK